MNLYSIIKSIILGLGAFASCSLPAHAMEFRLFFQSDLNINVLVGEGPIIAGDAERFRIAAPQADRDAEGHVILALNSLGGSVSAAFDLVEEMDRVGVFTIVPDNALCASACASIVYASGVRRNVVGTGRLGFHSCYRDVGARAQNSSFCNEVIAQHAISRGLAHASVSLFVKDFGAREMAWVDRKIACGMLIGMCRPTLQQQDFAADSAVSPSFDCAKANKLVEGLICTNPELAKMDVRMSIAYFNLRASSKNARQLLVDQRVWLRDERNKCTSTTCLTESYRKRIRELELRFPSAGTTTHK